MTATIAVGDTVKFRAKHLRSVGCYGGDLAFAQGKVTGIREYCGIAIATVDWSIPSVDPSANVLTLVRIEDMHLDSAE